LVSDAISPSLPGRRSRRRPAFPPEQQRAQVGRQLREHVVELARRDVPMWHFRGGLGCAHGLLGLLQLGSLGAAGEELVAVA